MKESKLNQSILEKIHNGEIKPHAKWYFIAKDALIWLMVAMSVFLGAISFSLILYILVNNDWQLYMHIQSSLLFFVVLTLPYVWILLLAFWLLCGYLQFAHTKKGYKFKHSTVIGITLVVSGIIGLGLFAAGMPNKVDDSLSRKSEFYNKHVNPKSIRWVKPHQGRLAGVITHLEKPEIFEIKDFRGDNWIIVVEQRQTTRPVFMTPIRVDMRVKMIGQQIADNTFRADIVGPWVTHPTLLR